MVGEQRRRLYTTTGDMRAARRLCETDFWPGEILARLRLNADLAHPQLLTRAASLGFLRRSQSRRKDCDAVLPEACCDQRHTSADTGDERLSAYPS